MSAAPQSPITTNAKPRAGWTTDLRAQPARLFNPMRPWLRNDFSVIGEEELRQIVTQLHGCQPLGRRGRLWLFVMIAAVLLLVFGSLGVRALTTGHPPLGSLFSALLNPAIFPAIVASFIPIYIARTQRLQKVEHVLLQHGRCPHCGYRLRDIPVDAHDQSVCPECAHVWLLAEESLDSSSRVASEASRRRLTIFMLLITGLTVLAVTGTLIFVLR